MASMRTPFSKETGFYFSGSEVLKQFFLTYGLITIGLIQQILWSNYGLWDHKCVATIVSLKIKKPLL